METSNSTSSLAERLKSWRSELKGLGLTKDDRDELQAHMEDVLEELQAKGLSEDEAWIVARHRIGEVAEIRKEFNKMERGRNPAINNVFFWMLLSFLGFALLEVGDNMISIFTSIGQIPFINFFYFAVMCLIAWWIISTRDIFRGYTRLGVFSIAFPLILLSLFFGFTTDFVGPQCYNSNKVFRDKPPKSDVYVKELVKQFTQTGSDNLYYRFGHYYKENNRDYIVLKALGNGFCGFITLEITNSKRLEHLIRVKGKSYTGSLWRGLKFDLVADKAHTRFIFRDVERIVD